MISKDVPEKDSLRTAKVVLASGLSPQNVEYNIYIHILHILLLTYINSIKNFSRIYAYIKAFRRKEKTRKGLYPF